MKKKFLAAIAVLCAICVSVTLPASAGNGPNPHPTDSCAYILVKGAGEDNSAYLYSAQNPDSVSPAAGMSYDKETNTLTLNNFNAPDTGIVTNEMGDDFTIQVMGTNRIAQIYAWGFGYGGSVTLTGTGELSINENKQEQIPIYLNAEGANAKCTIASGVTLRAYSQPGCPSICVDDSSAANDGIVFQGNAVMNQKVNKAESTEPAYCSAYRTDENPWLYVCTPKDSSDTGTYGALQYLDSNLNPYYVICRVIEDETVGKIAIPAQDAYGEPLSSDNFVISEDPDNADMIKDAVDTTWKSDLGKYTKEGEPDLYGCYHWTEISFDNEQRTETEYYSMYRLVDVENSYIHSLFAIPVENEIELSAIPDGYTQMWGNTYYYYNYNEEIIDLKGNIVDPCAQGHKAQTITTKATTTTDGKIVTTCSVCKKTLSTTVIPKVASVELSSASYTYNGKGKTPSVTVQDSTEKSLKENTDYTVSYAKGRKSVGEYTVTVAFSGNYSGTTTLSFTIQPKSTSISKLTAGKQKFTVKWKKQAAQTTGYQIQYSTSSKFKSAKTVTVSKNKTTSKTISKLKNTKYYVRIRTYKTVKVNGKSTKICSSWSKARTVKVK